MYVTIKQTVNFERCIVKIMSDMLWKSRFELNDVGNPLKIVGKDFLLMSFLYFK